MQPPQRQPKLTLVVTIHGMSADVLGALIGNACGAEKLFLWYDFLPNPRDGITVFAFMC